MAREPYSARKYRAPGKPPRSYRILGLKRSEQLEWRSGQADGVPWIVAEYRDVAGHYWKRLDMPGLALHAEFRHAAL